MVSGGLINKTEKFSVFCTDSDDFRMLFNISAERWDKFETFSAHFSRTSLIFGTIRFLRTPQLFKDLCFFEDVSNFKVFKDISKDSSFQGVFQDFLGVHRLLIFFY